MVGSNSFFRRITHICVLLMLLGLIPVAAHAQSAGSVARMGFGARGVALGNALAADGSGYASAFYNPALAPFVPAQSLEAAAAVMAFDRRMEFVQFSTPMRPRAGVAAGLVHASVSGIDGRDGSGYHTREYSTNEYMVFLTFGTRVTDRITAGATLQVFRNELVQQLRAVHTIGIDLGLSMQVTHELRLGLIVDDLLARYSWDTSGFYDSGGRTNSDRVPTRLRLGAAYDLPQFDLSLYAEHESRFSPHTLREQGVVIIGGEPARFNDEERIVIHESLFRVGSEWRPSEVFALRGGIDRIGVDGMDSLRPAAGLLIEQPIGTLVLRAEYTAVSEGYSAGLAHILSLRVFL